jgi:hypothetical protein
MWPPLRGVLEPFSADRLLLSQGHGSPYHTSEAKTAIRQRRGAPAPARWRGSGRLQKRSVEHASHRRGPTSDSAISSELARCYCPYSSRSGGLPGRRSSTQQTTGLHRTSMAKVCKSDGQGTFAGTQGNGEVAPIPDLPGLALGQAVRPFADIRPRCEMEPPQGRNFSRMVPPPGGVLSKVGVKK